MSTPTLRLAAAFVLSSPALLAQCPQQNAWIPLGGCAAPSGSVTAMVPWDPDGPGPLGMHVVCGGSFAYAGDTAAANVAVYDPASRTWSALGAGFDGAVNALAVLPNGALVAAGWFTSSGAQAVERIALWNGAVWLPLGTGIGTASGEAVYSLLALPNGGLIAGGSFATAGGFTANNIASWNGLAWSPLGGGVTGVPVFQVPIPTGPAVNSLALRSTGEVIAAGLFTTAGGAAAHCVARWSNGAWSSLGFGPSDRMVDALVRLANDDIVVSRSDQFGSHDVVRWNGATWSPMGSTFLEAATAFCELANGTLLAHTVNRFTAFGELLQWTGTAWAPVPAQGFTDTAGALVELGNGELMLASPRRTRGVPTVQRLVASTWQAPAPGLDGWVEDIAAADGDVVIGGFFRQVGDVPASGVAVRRNGVWSALGGGVDGSVQAVLRARNGDWIVGGQFWLAGAVPVNHIARWDGTQWQPIGDPMSPVLAIAELPNGDLVASTANSTILRWNGTNWILIGTSYVSALAVLPSGDLIAGCQGPGAAVQRYSGGAWTPLGNQWCNFGEFVSTLRVLANGDVLVGGVFAGSPLAFDTFARWDGAAWTTMGQGVLQYVTDIDVLPNGDWLVSHISWSAPPLASPMRWDGSAWTPVAGLDIAFDEQQWRLAITDAGEAVCAGTFGGVTGLPAGGLAALLAGCPATAAPAGAGCTGPAGPVALALQSRPWLGGAYTARTTGLGPLAIAIDVFGLAAVSLPLANVLPQSLPGCTLHVSPDVLFATLATGGEVVTTWALPNAPALIGQSFRHQVVPFELAATGAITAVTSSNALLLTIGSW